jgi:hypothetical protein
VQYYHGITQGELTKLERKEEQCGLSPLKQAKLTLKQLYSLNFF